MRFASREEAGLLLGRFLLDKGLHTDAVLGLPRGGVVVAAQVARVLSVPLDVVVVRKIGHPRHREFAVGALAENDVVVLDQPVLERAQVSPPDLDLVIAEEKERLHAYEQTFHVQPPPDLHDRDVVIVDDGLATGATTEAAVLSVKKQSPRSVTVAVPVASDNGVARLERLATQVVALWIDPDFDAVGRYYERFTQTTDEEVLALLQRP